MLHHLVKERRARVRLGLLAAFGTLLFAADQVAGGMPYFRDILYYFLPQYEICRAALADGAIPLWHPYIYCGQPLLATWQVALGSPLSLPFLLLPFEIAIKLFWFLALGLAATGMFVLGGRLGLGTFGSAIAAIVYAGSGPMRTLGEWPNIVQSLAYLPLLLVTLVDVTRRRHGATLALGLMGALMILSGQPRQMIILGFSTLALLGALVAAQPPVERRESRALALRLAIAISLACAIAGMQLLPSLNLLHQSDRWSAGVYMATIQESFLHPLDLVTVISSQFWGNENMFFGPGRHLMPQLYLGLLGLWLAARGLAGRRGPIRTFAIIAIPASLVLAMSEPLYWAVTELTGKEPFLRIMGHMVLAGLPAVALLCGRGAETLCEHPLGRISDRTPWSLLGTAGILGAVLFPFGNWLIAFMEVPAAVHAGSYLSRIRIDLAITAGILVAASLLVARTRGARRRSAGELATQSVILVLLTVDYLSALHGYQAKAPRETFTEPKVVSHFPLTQGRIFNPWWIEEVYPGMPISMLDSIRGHYWILAPNFPQLWRIRNAFGYEPFRLSTIGKLMDGWQNGLPDTRLACRILGVRWSIAPVSEDMPNWIKRADIIPGWALWEEPDPRPLAAVVPRTVVNLPWQALAGVPSRGRATISRESWNDLVVDVRATSPALLYLTTPWYSGWKSFVNGTRTRIGRAGGILISTPVPRGRSRVNFIYSPLPFKLGLLAGSITLAGLAGYAFALLAFGAFRRRQY